MRFYFIAATFTTFLTGDHSSFIQNVFVASFVRKLGSHCLSTNLMNNLMMMVEINKPRKI